MVEAITIVVALALAVLMGLGVPYLIGLGAQNVLRRSELPPLVLLLVAAGLTFASFRYGMGGRLDTAWPLIGYALTGVFNFVAMQLGAAHGWKLVQRSHQRQDPGGAEV